MTTPQRRPCKADGSARSSGDLLDAGERRQMAAIEGTDLVAARLRLGDHGTADESIPAEQEQLHHACFATPGVDLGSP